MAAAWGELLAGDTPRSAPSIDGHNRELYEALEQLRLKERNLERQLRKVQQLKGKLAVLSLVASNTDHAVVITDRNGLIEWVNDGFSRITGYEPFEVVGKKPGDVLQGPLTDPGPSSGFGRRSQRRKLHRGDSELPQGRPSPTGWR